MQMGRRKFEECRLVICSPDLFCTRAAIYPPSPLEKFRNAKVVLAEFSAPDANKLRLVVSVKRVRQVIQSNPVIFHEKARSVLVFPGKLRLAVRETPEEARQKLIS